MSSLFQTGYRYYYVCPCDLCRGRSKNGKCPYTLEKRCNAFRKWFTKEWNTLREEMGDPAQYASVKIVEKETKKWREEKI